jgi:nucleoside-diphosphate-sugar epimerase
MLPRILITGATGFVGRGVMAAALGRGWPVRAVTRRSVSWPAGVEGCELPEQSEATDWTPLVRDVGVVVHCAARVHVMQEAAVDPLAEYRRVNVAGTLRLARQAAAAGVRRFVFLSSIKVNGERTAPGKPFTADDPPRPADPYGLSKDEAERGLRALARETGLEVAIIRPPLVYGPGVQANFLALARWIRRGRPLPLGRVRNRRSLVARDNLADLVLRCAEHPAAANRTLLVADGEALSTAELCLRLAAAMGCPARLLPVPVAALRAAGWLTGRRAVIDRLCGSLEVDDGETRRLLGWQPPLSVDEALRQTVADLA